MDSTTLQKNIRQSAQQSLFVDCGMDQGSQQPAENTGRSISRPTSKKTSKETFKRTDKRQLKSGKPTVYGNDEELSSQFHLAEAKRLAKQIRRLSPNITLDGTATLYAQSAAKQRRLDKRARKLEEQKVGQAICQHLLAHLKTIH